jgi:Mor family transcriptional regulator
LFVPENEEMEMKYRNAGEILPEELVKELQKYAEGELIYVPGKQKRKAGWGTVNGSREQYALRNMQMARSYKSGASIEDISRQFFLSKDSIRKIVRGYQE